MDENKLISLMENFTGQKFQWIKTTRPDLLGKVVTCRNIEPRADRFFAVFDDGSSVDTSQLNSNLIMIHGDMKPLSKSEVESIAGPRRPSPQPAQPVQSSAGPVVNNGPIPIPDSLNQSQSQPVTKQPAPAPVVNMFDMFSSESSQINLSLAVNLPDKKLLKMMYASAEDKDKFLDQLSEYVFREINKQVIKESISSMVVPPAPAKKEKPGPTITVKEIHES